MNKTMIDFKEKDLKHEVLGLKNLLQITESRIKDKDELIVTQKLIIESLTEAKKELAEEVKMLKGMLDTLIEAQGRSEMESFYADAEGFYDEENSEDLDED